MSERINQPAVQTDPVSCRAWHPKTLQGSLEHNGLGPYDVRHPVAAAIEGRDWPNKFGGAQVHVLISSYAYMLQCVTTRGHYKVLLTNLVQRS